ncbi:pyroglutamyl-peptidase 1-like protein isoform X4 [Bubalus bubalis]|uniref:pyroglutamyl-peptidase 1-like protein isoform X4 n=1 Tax=Bubalus bubalis TaxID=89462 RepID=UPI001E1B6EAB|nr:pyroglutamyl-peptidase 1-like protein isoform X4 [Bubalus bubalis]
MDSRSSCVVVTGFGPFRQHLVNSSWEAVKELSKLGLGNDMEVELQTLQLPVDYREVKQRVARIWEDLQPQFVVHVGVDPAAKAIFLEQCSKNRGYRDADIRGFRPECGVCLPDGPEVIASEVSMKAVSRRAAVQGAEVAFSRDAVPPDNLVRSHRTCVKARLGTPGTTGCRASAARPLTSD